MMNTLQFYCCSLTALLVEAAAKCPNSRLDWDCRSRCNSVSRHSGQGICYVRVVPLHRNRTTTMYQYVICDYQTHATDLQSLLVGQGAPPERVVLDAPGLHLEPLLLVLPLRRARLRSGKDPEAF